MYNFWFDASVAPVEKRGGDRPVQARAGGVCLDEHRVGRAPRRARARPRPRRTTSARARRSRTAVRTPSLRSARRGAGPDACDSSGGGTGAIQSDVWFRYTYQPYADACAGSITIDTCGSDFDAKIAVYSGTTCPTAASVPLACAEGGGPCGGTSAGVTFPATIGATYLIRVGSLSGAGGNGVLNIAAPFCIGAVGACCYSNGTCIDMQGSFNCMGGTFMARG